MPPVRARSRRHPHDDAPDTAAAFQRLAEMPDGPARQALRQEVVSAWLPMAGRLARQYRDRGESLEDIEQVARLGLVKAVDRYDPGQRTAFESFAVPTILGEIKRHFRDHMWAVHVPRRVQDLRNRVRSAKQELTTAVDDHPPSAEELAAKANLSVKEVRAGLEALDSFSVLSLDAAAPDSDNGYSLVDTLADGEPGYALVTDREAARHELRELPERERQVLYLRFFRDMTQSSIAEEIGVSQMHVSRLISRACRKVRDQVEGRDVA
ncbi:SigB/SigF/SigG family RNA polymerase sigma factor [Streptomyces beihaiensis]|uniref:SigB/SigF/SigG family RNA polymerase sigma factor n=1 Tax=Streptomyces beihaiensis TaxID=2984495 RepID=A0ABT3U0C3_9ACTN|nr:SigB/SigF/SigG family RNA polymerase sigma factor [Streptomyces beihaiensis]MCX3061735.1 SigB/SigF/SigG family RNA polymerase sigma factor [Streptomyces beihaiensis]